MAGIDSAAAAIRRENIGQVGYIYQNA